MSTLEAIVEKLHERALPVGWQRVQLADVAEINPSRPRGFQRDASARTTFVPMPAVDGVTGTIAKPETRPYSEVATGYTYFAEGDVLFAKITPCMQNGKHAVARDLINGIGFASTEFHVIRPNGGIIADWIYFFLRQPSVLHDATNYFTGAVGQQRVPDSFLKALRIPLPPLSEQQRITAALRERMAAVERARAAGLLQLAAARTLPAAYLRHDFPNDTWPLRRLGDGLSRIEAGTSVLSLERPAEDGEWGVLKVSAVTWTQFNPKENKAVPLDYKPESHEQVRVGDLLISRSNTAQLVGAVVRVRQTPSNLMLSDKTLRLVLKPEVYSSEFLEFALRSRIVRAYIEANATGTSFSMRNISQDTIRLIPVPTPPLDEQRKIAAHLGRHLEETGRLVGAINDQRARIESLPAALLRQVFAGASH